MKIKLGYGTSTQDVDVPAHNLLGILMANAIKPERTGADAVMHALENPVGTPRLSQIVKPGERIVIITSDMTRPVPSKLILPAVLDELWRAGIRPQDIRVVFALGCHRRQTEAEMRRLVGDAVFEQVLCMDGDPDDTIHMGVTSYGTPVDITRAVAQADRRIGVGNIEFHYFAGYSGGAKAIMPGVSTRAAIQANHSRMVLPTAAAGRLEGNPVRMDIEEALTHCPLDFIVNVVLDEHKQIVYAAAGHPVLAHRDGCRYLDRIYKIPINERADLVIASNGGSPKDINLYQTQKALDNAKYAVKDGGVIILVGSCAEGFGEDVFEAWMRGAQTPESLTKRIQEDFQLGGHKAAAIALVLAHADIYLVSDMNPDTVHAAFLTPFGDVQAALITALDKLGSEAKILVMPHAGSTLPQII